MAANFCFAAGSTETKPRQTWQVAPFFNLRILGSQDARAGIYASYQTQRPEPRFTYRGHNLDLAIEFGFSYSYGGGWKLRPHDETYSYNILGLAKYEKTNAQGAGIYFEFGWGFHYASEATFDLDSRLSSTPTGGFGYMTGQKSGMKSIGLRYYHISNAGLKGANQGQNQLMFLTSFSL